MILKSLRIKTPLKNFYPTFRAPEFFFENLSLRFGAANFFVFFCEKNKFYPTFRGSNYFNENLHLLFGTGIFNIFCKINISKIRNNQYIFFDKI